MLDEFETAIKALLAKVAEAKEPADAARLAEIVINLSHAAAAMAAAKKATDEADHGGAGS